MEQLKNIYSIQQKLDNLNKLNNLDMACPSHNNSKNLPFDKYISVYIAYNVYDIYKKVPNFPNFENIHVSLHNVIFNRDLFGEKINNMSSPKNQIKNAVKTYLNSATATPCSPIKFEQYGDKKQFNVILYNNFSIQLTNFRLAIYKLFLDNTEYKSDIKSKKECTINGKIYNVFYDIKTKQPLYAVENHYFSAGHSPHVSLPGDDVNQGIRDFLKENPNGLDIKMENMNELANDKKIYISIGDETLKQYDMKPVAATPIKLVAPIKPVAAKLPDATPIKTKLELLNIGGIIGTQIKDMYSGQKNKPMSDDEIGEKIIEAQKIISKQIIPINNLNDKNVKLIGVTYTTPKSLTNFENWISKKVLIIYNENFRQYVDTADYSKGGGNGIMRQYRTLRNGDLWNRRDGPQTINAYVLGIPTGISGEFDIGESYNNSTYIDIVNNSIKDIVDCVNKNNIKYVLFSSQFNEKYNNNTLGVSIFAGYLTSVILVCYISAQLNAIFTNKKYSHSSPDLLEKVFVNL